MNQQHQDGMGDGQQVGLSPEQRRELVEAPISIGHYGGRSFAGYCPIDEHDSAHARYLRAWRRSQQASSGAESENGYMP
jgi:hypothetical protein